RSEDILFCVDVDVESKVEMKAHGPNGRPTTRLYAIKQAVLSFVNSKLNINPDHRFSFASFGSELRWVRREFSNQIPSAVAEVQALTAADSSYGKADLTLLFKMAAYEAKKSQQQGRIFRVILIYCRSSTPPEHRWPVNEKNFTLDVVYLHDKPSTENCPQRVYDRLVDALEHVTQHEGYILESGQGLSRVVIRHLSMLLCHPDQRCIQDDLDIPKSLMRRTVVQAESVGTEESTVSTS
ncbi:uncharacterized protein LOC109836575, partial [Asparagus officinalis]|uniref:uncharacterized protein LOC109836575 n=1 Tax=Asparagus officinalis TaxID=4686 RepID=UPI00098E679D